MKDLYGKICIFISVMTLFVSCGPRGVISRGDLSKIYADMFVRDQWIKENSDYRTEADTCLVYESIFEKYGYSSEEYNKSIAYYMKDPDRFARILRKTNQILDKRIKELRRQKEIATSLMVKKQNMERYKTDYDTFYDRLHCPDSVERGDSMVYYLDTNVLHFEYNPELFFDTLYVGPSLIFPSDTTGLPKDSVVVDTLKEEKAIKVKKINKDLMMSNLSGKEATLIN